jgi:hypothetical protein
LNFSCIFSVAKQKTLKEKEKNDGGKADETRGEKGPNLTQKQLKKPDLERKSKGKNEKNLRKPYGGWVRRRWCWWFSWGFSWRYGGWVVGFYGAKPEMENAR